MKFRPFLIVPGNYGVTGSWKSSIKLNRRSLDDSGSDDQGRQLVLLNSNTKISLHFGQPPSRGRA